MTTPTQTSTPLVDRARLTAASPTGTLVSQHWADPDWVPPGAVPPGLGTGYVETRSHRRATVAAGLSTKMQEIAAFGGPPGTGKSTAVAELARRSGRDFVFAQFPQNARISDVNALLYEALTGHHVLAEEKIRQSDMRRYLVDTLSATQTGVIIDEVHILGVKGMQVLRTLHDQVKNRRKDRLGFPLWLVGVDVIAAAASADELADRIFTDAEFAPLTGGELLAVLHDLDARLQQTPDDVILLLDKTASGNLRRWNAILRVATALWPTHNEGLTGQMAQAILATRAARLRRRT